MKYEEALAHVSSFTFLAISDAISLVDKIYGENVVIPRGKNPHQDAEVLHLSIEDMDLPIQTKYDSDFPWETSSMSKDIRYRIKPDTADFEYKYDIEGFGVSVRTNKFYTEDMAELLLSQFASYTKVEETGRPKNKVLE